MPVDSGLCKVNVTVMNLTQLKREVDLAPSTTVILNVNEVASLVCLTELHKAENDWRD